MWGVPAPAMPQVNQRTENTDKINIGIKILPFKMSLVENGKKKADICIYKLNGKGDWKVIIHCSHYTRPQGQLCWMIRQKKINTFSHTNICHRYLAAIYKKDSKSSKANSRIITQDVPDATFISKIPWIQTRRIIHHLSSFAVYLSNWRKVLSERG